MSEQFDLATLSVRIDTSGTAAGVQGLNDLSKASERTEQATEKAGAASSQLQREIVRMHKEVAASSKAFEVMRNKLKELERMDTLVKHVDQMTEASKRFQQVASNTKAVDALHTKMSALEGATARLTSSFGDTSSITRFMGELSKATSALSKMQDDARAAKSVQEVAKAAESAKAPVEQLSKGLGGLAGNLMGMVAVGATLRSVTTEALGFSTAMAQVSTLLEDNQLGMMGQLAESAKRLGAQFGRGPTDQAKALYEIMSAGAADAAKATEMLAIANKLAIGGVTEVSVAADGLTSIMASYGTQLRSATQAADAMFVSAADGKTSIETIARHIGKVAPIASQTGVSLQELLAANAALTKAGVKTETAMEGVRAILAQVAKPSNEAAILAKELGIEFNIAGLKSKGFAGFLQDMKDKTGGSTELLAALVGGVEALLPVMTLSGPASVDFATSLQNMETSAGKTEAAFKKMAETPQMKVDQLRARFAGLRVEVGESLLNTISPVMDGLLKNFEEVTTAARYLAQALAVLGAARAVAWGQEWTKALLDKAAAAKKARESVVEAVLAEASYKRAQGESRAEALKAALAHLEKRQALLQSAAALEGPFTVAHTRAAIASNTLAQAKVREAIAIEGATFATRAGSAALAAMGGPIGVVVIALGAAVTAFAEFGRAAEEAREKAMQHAQESAAAVGRGAQIVVDLTKQTKAIDDQRKALELLAIAKEEAAALGGKYQDLLTSEVDTIGELRTAIRTVADEDLKAAQSEIARLSAAVKEKQKLIIAVNWRWAGEGKPFHEIRKDKRFAAQIEEKLVPLEKELAVHQQRAAEVQKALISIEEAAKEEAALADKVAGAHGRAGAAATKSASETIESGKKKVEEAKKAAVWLSKLEEDVRAIGKTKAGALNQSDEYMLLTEEQKKIADVAIAKLKDAEATKKAAQARDELAKKAQTWLERIQEEAGALGKSKAEALSLTDEYKALSSEQKKQADVAIARLKEAEATKALEKAEKDRLQNLQQLNRELGDQSGSRFAEAQQLLRTELDAGRLTLKDYNAQLAKARELWTPEGRAEAQLAKELENLEKQLNPLADAQKRMAAVEKLFQEGRIGAAAYRREVAKLQEQLSTGFALAQDAVTSAANHMEDAFVTFATTGQFSFRAMVDGMLKDLARLLAHKAFLALVDTATGALIGMTTAPAASSGGSTVGGADLSGMFGSMLGGGAGAGGVGKLAAGADVPQVPKLYVPSKADILPPAGEGGGQVTVSVVNHFGQDGSVTSEVQSSGGRAESERLARAVEAAFTKFILREMQPGGQLYNFVLRTRR
ncbi:phage tail tape measure protein [Myxococcus sp. AS-1-15]|uniref:phage tail tape measure protein n=1 Tax=Myxococcus sp. AS-1-15 TaxID=2874600 RepID=UPI001CBD5A0D|nr:phage tail tape measure protein [Myxococcus sp. AS-1-15]